MDIKINKTANERTFTLEINGNSRNFLAVFEASNDGNIVTIKNKSGISSTVNLDTGDTLEVEGIAYTNGNDAVIVLNEIVAAGFKSGGSSPIPTLDEVLAAGNVSDKSISAGEATNNSELATLGQAKEVLSDAFNSPDIGNFNGKVLVRSAKDEETIKTKDLFDFVLTENPYFARTLVVTVSEYALDPPIQDVVYMIIPD